MDGQSQRSPNNILKRFKRKHRCDRRCACQSCPDKVAHWWILVAESHRDTSRWHDQWKVYLMLQTWHKLQVHQLGWAQRFKGRYRNASKRCPFLNYRAICFFYVFHWKASQQSAWRFQDVRLLGHIIRSKILEPLVKLGSHNSVSCLASGSRGSNVHLDRWHGMIFQLCIYNFVLQNFWKYLGYMSILIRIYN